MTNNIVKLPSNPFLQGRRDLESYSFDRMSNFATRVTGLVKRRKSIFDVERDNVVEFKPCEKK